MAFYNCRSLTSVELGNEIVSIGVGAFGHTSIASISLPSSLRTLGQAAFLFTEITTLTIPVGTSQVGPFLFAFANSLTTVTIPNTVTDMDEYALVYGGIQTVYYCGNNASVLKAIYNASYPWGISPTCVAPVTAPVTSSNSNP
jgi:hypothetical protein